MKHTNLKYLSEWFSYLLHVVPHILEKISDIKIVFSAWRCFVRSKIFLAGLRKSASHPHPHGWWLSESAPGHLRRARLQQETLSDVKRFEVRTWREALFCGMADWRVGAILIIWCQNDESKRTPFDWKHIRKIGSGDFVIALFLDYSFCDHLELFIWFCTSRLLSKHK